MILPAPTTTTGEPDGVHELTGDQAFGIAGLADDAPQDDAALHVGDFDGDGRLDVVIDLVSGSAVLVRIVEARVGASRRCCPASRRCAAAPTWAAVSTS